MINIKNYGVKPYQFCDDEIIITCPNPTQGMFAELTNAAQDKSRYMEIIDDVFDYMLPAEHKHYKDEVPFDVKIALITDYIQYHTKELGSGFLTGSDNTQS